MYLLWTLRTAHGDPLEGRQVTLLCRCRRTEGACRFQEDMVQVRESHTHFHFKRSYRYCLKVK